MKSLILILALASPTFASTLQQLDLYTSTAQYRVSGKIGVAASSTTPTTLTTSMDGTTGITSTKPITTSSSMTATQGFYGNLYGNASSATYASSAPGDNLGSHIATMTVYYNYTPFMKTYNGVTGDYTGVQKLIDGSGIMGWQFYNTLDYSATIPLKLSGYGPTLYGSGSLGYYSNLGVNNDTPDYAFDVTGGGHFTSSMTVDGGYYGDGSHLTGISQTITSTSVIEGQIGAIVAQISTAVYTTGSYSDPTWITSLAGTKVTGVIPSSATGTYPLSISGTAAVATSYSETDPIFSVHPSTNVTNTKIANWDTAYGWGNSYLTAPATFYIVKNTDYLVAPASFTYVSSETDPLSYHTGTTIPPANIDLSTVTSALALKGTLASVNTWSATNDFQTITTTSTCIGGDCRTDWPTGGDNLGSHVATQTITANYGILASTFASSFYFSGSGSDIVMDRNGLDWRCLGAGCEGNSGVMIKSADGIQFMPGGVLQTYIDTDGSIVHQSSFTANYIYGDGSHLTGLTGASLIADQTFSGINTFTSSVTSTGIMSAAQFDILGQKFAWATSSASSNTVVGLTAAPSIVSTGTGNVIIGNNAGRTGTGISSNTVIGSGAGQAMTTQAKSTFVGWNAGVVATSGLFNTFVGSSAGSKVTTGSRDSYFGESSGGLQTGSDNTCLGYSACSGISGATGGSNTSVGEYSSMSGIKWTNNSNLGVSSLRNNRDGYANVVMGYSAAYGDYNSSFSSTVVLGATAGLVLSTAASANILIGYGAGDSITTGHDNIVIGYGQDTPSATSNSMLNIGGLIVGDLAGSSATVNGSLSATTFYGSGAGLTGLPAGGVTVATFTVVLHSGGDVFMSSAAVATNNPFPNIGMQYVFQAMGNNPTINISSVQCYTLLTSTVSPTSFNISVSSDTGNVKTFTMMFTSSVSVQQNASYSAWTAPDANATISTFPTAIGLQTYAVPQSGTLPQEYGCIIRYWKRID